MCYKFSKKNTIKFTVILLKINIVFQFILTKKKIFVTMPKTQHFISTFFLKKKLRRTMTLCPHKTYKTLRVIKTRLYEESTKIKLNKTKHECR